MTHVFCILDRSGSMMSVEKATVDGFNEYIEGLRKQKGIRVTLVQFDDQYQKDYEALPIKDVKPLVLHETYQPRGSTALIDAACKTLVEAEDKVGEKDKALVVIITDGMENSSREFKSADFKRIVEKLEGKKNWTFTYLGANQDAWAEAQQWGFSQGNVASFNSTDAGVRQVFRTHSMNTGHFAAQGMSVSSTNQYFSKEDKDKLEDVQ